MKLKIAITVAVMSICISANAQVYTGKTANKQTNGAWDSFSITNGNDLRLRASAMSGRVALVADQYVPSCVTDLSLSAPISGAAQESPAAHIPGAVRIDDGPLHSITYFSPATAMGDTGIYMTVDPTPEYSSIISEMMSGSIVRFKIGNDSNPTILAFPLNGFAVSAQRIDVWCKNIREYLEKNQSNPPKTKGSESKKPRIPSSTL